MTSNHINTGAHCVCKQGCKVVMLSSFKGSNVSN